MAKSTHTALYDRLRERLIRARTEAGLTQRQLAERYGREQSVIARMETGERRIDVVELYWLCGALGVDPRQLLSALLDDFESEDD